jgi:hypothetical protein
MIAAARASVAPIGDRRHNERDVQHRGLADVREVTQGGQRAGTGRCRHNPPGVQRFRHGGWTWLTTLTGYFSVEAPRSDPHRLGQGAGPGPE